MPCDADGKVEELLKDGTIKLLSCDWLLGSAAEDLTEANSLGLDGKLPKLMRRQDLEKKLPRAFLEVEEAEKIFKEKQRKVLVLSYGWLSAADPDPLGQRLDQKKT